MEWYYADGDKQIGPLETSAFDALVQNGTIQSATLVWNSTMTDWTAYGSLKSKPAAPSADASETRAAQGLACSECGKTMPAEEMARYGDAWVCPVCKPVFVQKIKEGVPVGSALEYGGFWIRFGAKFIDGLIIMAVMMVIYMPIMFFFIGSMAAFEPEGPDDMGFFFVVQLLMNLLQFILPLVYTTWFIGKYGATPGKMACKLKVVTSDGGKVSYKRALGRSLSEWISSLILMIGYIMAAFDDQKRTLHDHICNTRVVVKR